MKRILIAIFLSFGLAAQAIEVISDKPNEKCEEINFRTPTPGFRDPSLYLSIVNISHFDPKQAEELMEQEDPLLSTFKGRVMVRRLSEPLHFNQKEEIIQRRYEMADPRLQKGNNKWIVPVIFCRQDNSPNSAYSDQLGFFFLEDLKEKAWTGEGGSGMPPSTQFIPKYTPRPEFKE